MRHCGAAASPHALHRLQCRRLLFAFRVHQEMPRVRAKPTKKLHPTSQTIIATLLPAHEGMQDLTQPLRFMCRSDRRSSAHRIRPWCSVPQTSSDLYAFRGTLYSASLCTSIHQRAPITRRRRFQKQDARVKMAHSNHRPQ